MLIDRPQVTETSAIVNATVASGTSNPANPDIGELFYRTDLNQLVVYGSGGWVEAGSSNLAAHVGDDALHLTSAQNTLLDGLPATLTSTELGYVDGVTSSIQTQLNAKLNRDGSNAATGNLNLAGFKLTNVGAATANADAVNLQTLETEISESVPVGARGQVPFIATSNTRTSVQGFTAQVGQFVESDTELAAAQTRIISNETVFNEWYRFSHANAIGGTLTRTGGVSRFQFQSANLSSISASFPVGTVFTLSSANSTFTGTHTVTSVSNSGQNHVMFFSQVGQPDVAVAVSGTIARDTLQPAFSGELSSWVYNSGPDTISSTVNSDGYIGFVSDRAYSSYELETQLSSTSGDDDTIGVVIAWAIEGGREYTLSALRSVGGGGFTWRVIYNYGRSEATVITANSAPVAWGNGAFGANAGEAGYVSGTAGQTWANFPTGTVVRVVREGDVFTLDTTQLNSTTYVPASVITIDLTSLPILAKFRGPASYGFGAFSQSFATFDTLSFTDNQNAIYDIRDGSKFEYVGGSWVLQPAESLLGDIGPGRFLFDRYTEKLFYVDEQLGPIKLVTNAGEDLVPVVSQLQADFSTHVADDARHLTTAQNTLLDGLAATLTATELNYMDGVTSSVQTQLNARLRLTGADTMTGNLQMGGNRVTGLGEPSTDTDAATKAYVDTFVQGLSWKQAVRVATTAGVVLSGLQTIDGVTVAANDRVLVKSQVNAAENGIWLASASAWSRAPDANTSNELNGAATFVREGTTNADSAWVQVNAVPTVGTSPVVWSRFAASGGVTPGVGIDITNAVISVDYGNGLTVSGNDLIVDANTADFAFTAGELNLSTLVGLTAGTYGSTTTIPVVTVNTKGRVTGISSATPAFQVADPLITAIADIPNGLFGLITRTANATATVRSLGVSGTGVTITNANGVSGNPTININDTSVNTASRIVSRDASGNFAAGTITASLTGGASLNVLKTGDTMSGNLTFATAGTGLRWTGLTGLEVSGDIGTGNPGIAFSAGDYIDYSRGSNIMTFSAGAPRLTIDLTAISTPGGFRLSHAAPATTLAWFSTPAYGISQGDNRTYFGFNNAGTVGNFIRGAFTTIDSPVTINSTLTTGAITTNADLTIADAEPILVLQDTTNVGGAGQTGFVSLRDSASAEQGYIGFRNNTNTDLRIGNALGDGVFFLGGAERMRVASTGNVTIGGKVLDPTPVTYGTFALSGSTGGYSGIQFTDTPNDVTFMTRVSDGLTGVYETTTALWQWRYDTGSDVFQVYDGTALRTVYHAGNLDPEVTPVANSVLLRDGSGHSYHNYINQSSYDGELVAASISQVITTNGTDNFFRKASILELARGVVLQSVAPTGTWNFTSTGAVGAANGAPLAAFATGTNSARMTFHRSGSYAINIGLDADNVFRIGGWSDGTNIYRAQLTSAGILTLKDTGYIDLGRGLAGGYSTLTGTGTNWGGSIWGIGPSFIGTGDGITYDTAGSYGISWLRGTHVSALPAVGEGLYTIVNGVVQAGMGTGGLYTDAQLTVGSTSASGITLSTTTQTFYSGAIPVLTLTAGLTGTFLNSPSSAGFRFTSNSVNSVDLNSEGVLLRVSGDLTNPSIQWSTDTNIGIFRHSASTVGIKGGLNASGNITAFSDRRVKTDIQPIENALYKVGRIEGVTFERTDVVAPRQTGVIAQDVEEVLPEAVITGEDGMKSVAYGNLVGLLIEAIKELKAEVDALKAAKEQQ